MSNNKKYVSLSKLQTFLNNLKNTFALLTHTHKLSDITDYTVDTELSSISTNPVQNKVLDAEFDAISQSFEALELAVDDKAPSVHTHTVSEVTDIQVALDGKSDIVHTHSYDDLRNKPFYEGTDYSSILPNGASTVNFYEWGGSVYGAAITDAPKALTQDLSHKVIWDGMEYTMTSAYGGDNEAGNPIVSLGAPYGDYSQYPFGIDSYQTASGTYEFSIHTNSTDVTHTIDILELGSSFVTLDERFIPDSIARTVDMDTALNEKANIDHTHNDIYYTKNQIDDITLITVEDIDNICAPTV